MPRTNKPMTLSDLLVGGGSSGGDDGSNSGTGGEAGGGLPSTDADNSIVRDMARQASNNNNGKDRGGLHKTCHIPTLPNAATAQALLERVTREFRFIAEERGYNVLSVSELCCCNDGLDFVEASSSSNGSSSRKLKKCQDNVLGYNRTVMSGGGRSRSNNKVHSIHLRLRHVRNHHHQFYDYEDVAGTLAHELAHCEHGPHNDAFFKLMDQFLEEHAVRMASNITTNGGRRAAVPSFSGTGQTLGGSAGGGSSGSGGTALGGSGTGRSRLLQPGGAGSGGAGGAGRKLGGDDAFTQWMTPAEAAAVAALARRRQEKVRQRMRDADDDGSSCCGGGTAAARPIVPDGILFPVASEPDRKPKANNDHADRKRPAAANTRDARLDRADENQSPNSPKTKRRQQAAAASSKNSGDIIDLTFSSDDDEVDDRKVAAVPKKNNSNARKQPECWSCAQCTFRNPHSISICNMCATPKV